MSLCVVAREDSINGVTSEKNKKVYFVKVVFSTYVN